jgi:hypothetical protein
MVRLADIHIERDGMTRDFKCQLPSSRMSQPYNSSRHPDATTLGRTHSTVTLRGTPEPMDTLFQIVRLAYHKGQQQLSTHERVIGPVASRGLPEYVPEARTSGGPRNPRHTFDQPGPSYFVDVHERVQTGDTGHYLTFRGEFRPEMFPVDLFEHILIPAQ